MDVYIYIFTFLKGDSNYTYSEARIDTGIDHYGMSITRPDKTQVMMRMLMVVMMMMVYDDDDDEEEEDGGDDGDDSDDDDDDDDDDMMI